MVVNMNLGKIRILNRKQNKEKNSEENRKKKRITFIIAIIVLIAIPAVLAWFYYGAKHAYTADGTLMTPYNLYLLDASKQDRLRLTVGSLHPGETKQIVVCVSSHDANSTTAPPRESTFPYTMELAYTQNLPLNYKLYELTPATKDTGDVSSSYTTKNKDTEVTNTYWFKKVKYDGVSDDDLFLEKDADESASKNKEMYGTDATSDTITNWVQYDTYSKTRNPDTDNNGFKLSLNDETKQYNYYLIEISWQDGIDFSSYTKETDLVYLIAKAGVPRPVEKSNN